jgi:hypothetical protein
MLKKKNSKAFVILWLIACSSCCYRNMPQSSYYVSDFMSKKAKKDTCLTLLIDIQYFDENYKTSKDTFFFNEAIKLIDSALSFCDYKFGLIETKFELFVTKKIGQKEDIDWFENLDLYYYNEDLYYKTFFINTLKSLFYDNQGDTILRNQVNKDIVSYMEKQEFGEYLKNTEWQRKFLKENIDNRYWMDRFATYYYVRGRFENIDYLKNELVAYCIDDKNDEIQKYLKEINYIISILNVMDSRTYHFEYE